MHSSSKQQPYFIPRKLIVAVAAVIVSFGISLLYIQYFESDTQLWVAIAESKSEILEKQRANQQSVVLVCGGSSTSFGVEPTKTESNGSTILVNMGLNAGLGSRVLVGYCLTNMEAEDDLLLMVEPGILNDTELITAKGYQFCFAMNDMGLMTWNTNPTWISKQLAFFKSLPYLRPGISSVFFSLALTLLQQPSHYQFEDLRHDGLMVTDHRFDLGDGSIDTAQTISSENLKLLEELAQLLSHNGSNATYAFPWKLTTLQNHKSSIQKRHQFSKMLPNRIAFLFESNDMGVKTDSTLFGDSPYHLTEKSATTRSQLLLSAYEDKSF